VTLLDPVQPTIDALCAVAGADAAVAALMGRANGAGGGAASPYMVPWQDDAIGTVAPILVYQVLPSRRVGGTGRTYRVPFYVAALAADDGAANLLIATFLDGLTLAAFRAQGLEACTDPATEPERVNAPWKPDADDPAKGRADVRFALLIDLDGVPGA
jgi:hypothetical protein